MRTIPHAEQKPQLVINWHLTEACNFGCRYCYAAWGKPCKKELVNNAEQTQALIRELAQFFAPSNMTNPLRQQMDWQQVRLNFAGGEPLLHDKKLLGIALNARKLGMDTSIITNGSRLTVELAQQLAPVLSLIGVSIDSAEMQINRHIGRVDRAGRNVVLDDLVQSLTLARQINPNLKVKLNSVINAANWNESLHSLLTILNPQKWKVLRMLAFENDELLVSDAQFAAFIARHQDVKHLMCVEDNQDMQESYLMIDPYGRFFQNGVNLSQNYFYSRPILEVGAAVAFNDITFRVDRFLSRYQTQTTAARQA